MNAREESKIEAGEVEIPEAAVEAGIDALDLLDDVNCYHGGKAHQIVLLTGTERVIVQEILAAARPHFAGEVETPCATCGDSPRPGMMWVTNELGSRMLERCPDCGVETPEAAVEAVMRALTDDSLAYASPTVLEMTRHDAERVITALLAQGWTPPGTEETDAK